MNKYGIDYGTTNSSIALSYIENKVTQTVVIDVEDTMPRTVMPSKVLITPTGYTVGREDAKSSNIRMIVRKPKDYLAPQKDYQAANIIKAAPPQQYIEIAGRKHPTKELIAAVLRRLLQKAKPKAQELGIKPDGVVMGVPVEYGEEQKKLLKEALVMAGFYEDYEEADRKTEFVSEPVAVAVDYGLKITEDKNVFIFDFGGGTLDVAVLNLRNDVSKINHDHLHPHNVIIKDGADIGGELMTKAFFINSFFSNGKYTLKEFIRAFGTKNVNTPEEMWDAIMRLGHYGDRFFEAVDRLKCLLSSKDRQVFDFPGPQQSLKQVNFTRQDFETALHKPIPGYSETIFDKIEQLIYRVLDHPSVGGISSIDSVILAGGSAMIPCVQEFLYDVFPGQLHERVGQSNALTSIVRGLSQVGCREDSILDDIVDNSYGFWDVGTQKFCPVVEKGTKVIDTAFDKIKKTGKYKEFVNNDSTARQMDIQIMQKNKYGETKLGTIQLIGTDDRRYRLYMNVDKKQGVLRCYLLDTKSGMWLDDTGNVNIEQCEYHLK